MSSLSVSIASSSRPLRSMYLVAQQLRPLQKPSPSPISTVLNHLITPQVAMISSSFFPVVRLDLFKILEIHSSQVWIPSFKKIIEILNQSIEIGIGILKAVPKKKVSHSRKRMRSAHKGLKPDLGIVACPACGEPKRQHFLCLHCYGDKILERRKAIQTPWEKGITP
ncbi:hypothetical protein O181_040073 [Austropuccinia psidii MF-1]|uniref:Large ribosomal subunit protein bL32m n=1 Tax=Austropuccinia psidii MF-1 TaxID=1389203 RepID=A0A9Q3DEM2_9BASI|nr:hypothetical protein [Austropuccinia psidii MF-1]